MSRTVLLVSGLVTTCLLAVGCRRSDPGEAAPSLRLIDLAGTATVASAVVPGDPDAAPSGAVIASEREPFEDLERVRVETDLGPRAGAVRIEAGGFGSGAVIRGPAAVFRVFAQPRDGLLTAKVRLAAAKDAEFRWVALSLEALHLKRLESKGSWARELLRVKGSAIARPEPLGPIDANGLRSYGVDVPRRSRAEHVLVGLFVTSGRVHVDELALEAALPTRSPWAASDDFTTDSPWTTPVEVRNDLREALVLAAPGSIRFRVTLPPGRPRLRFGVTVIARDGAPGVSAVARVSDGATSLERTVAIPPPRRTDGPRWHDALLDLESLAGRDVDVLLTADTDAPSRFAVGVAFGAPVIEAGAAAARPADVILVSVDTVRADHLSSYGYPKPTSPNLDALARDAVLFETAIAPSAWTLPSHVTLLTGQLPDRHGVHRSHRIVARIEAPLIARSFRRAGYRTVAVTGGGFVHPEFGVASGFEEFRSIDPSKDRYATRDPRIAEASRENREWIVSLLREPRARPLFLFVHTFAAHDYLPPDDDLVALGTPRRDVPSVRKVIGIPKLVAELEGAASTAPLERQLARYTLLYDGGVRLADRLIGEVVGAIDAAGRADRTIVVVVSDHGEELGEHGSGSHGHALHEELIHVPLVIRGPGVRARRVADVVSLADVAPTLLEWCGLPFEASRVDGRSLVPSLRGEALPPVVALARTRDARNGLVRALRGSRWKLIEQTRPDGEVRRALYDLLEDPHETVDLADREPGLAARLADLLERRVRFLTGLAPQTAEGPLSEDRIAELRELGYLDAR